MEKSIKRSPLTLILNQTDLQVPESEDDRLGEVHSVGSSVYRGGDDMRVDHQAPTPGL